MDDHPRRIPTTIEEEEADLRNVTRLHLTSSSFYFILSLFELHPRGTRPRDGSTENVMLAFLLALTKAYTPFLTFAEFPPKTVISSLCTS